MPRLRLNHAIDDGSSNMPRVARATEPATLSPLRTSSLREQAGEAIRAGIISGKIAADVIYSVPALAAELGVSATPVREAMLDLAGEGLVLAVRNRGYRVIRPTAKDLEDILSIRLMLEVPAMGQVAVTHEDGALDKLFPLADRLPSLARRGQVLAYLDADAELHLGLLALLGNPRLVDIVRQLRNQSRLFDLGRLLAAHKLSPAGAEHRELLDSIASRDRKHTEALTRTHLNQVRQAWARAAEDSA
jgi:DNA-binding GntR family transcriptional regulator